MASSSYPPKLYDGLGLGLGPHHQRYSSPPGTYDRSAADTEIESYRSRSPPWDETREAMILSMGGFGSPGAGGGYSPGRGGNGSPVVRRPVPQRGGTGTMPNSSPVTPMYQDEADVPSALRCVVLRRLCVQN